MTGGTLGIKGIRTHWDETLRLSACDFEQAGHRHHVADAAQAIRGKKRPDRGFARTRRIKRPLFILDWLQSVELRWRVNAGQDKDEARNALAYAVFINPLCEIQDRSFEQQRYRAIARPA